MSPRFFLQCLGLPRLTTAGGHELRLRVRKHMALLVFLAVENRVRHRRDHLIELLWPGVPASAGRQSLATALSNIRGRLGTEALEADRDAARLATGLVGLDLDRLEAGDVAGDDVTPPLAVSGFLEGFELPGVPEYHLWRDRQQARLLPAIQRGLIALADLARRCGDLPQLGRHADRLLAIDDLSEDGIRARMEASALAGDRITALRVFENWAGRLEQDLGAKPSPRLESMAMRLRRRGWERPVDSPIPAIPTEHWAGREFVGRTRQYRRLYEAWDRVQAGAAAHLLLTGVGGVGKTTLADRFTTALSLQGAQVARVRAYELERGIPYAAIGSAVEIFLDRPGAGATDPVALAELARVVPEVRRRFPRLPEIPDAQGESARIRFATAAFDLVRAVAEEHPVVIMLDDFDQADDASLAVLHLLMRRGRELRFMVVLTARTEWPHEAPTATRIRTGGAHLGLQEVELGPMPPEEAQLLLEALLRRAAQRATAAERKALLRAAAGYPLALELLLKHWEEHRRDAAFVPLDAMTADVSQAPESVYRRLAEGILTGLDATALMVLHLAAVLDRRLNELEMYRTVDLTPARTMGNLALLAARGVLRDSGAGLEFLNPMIRGHAYYTIPAGLRKVLHEGVAARLLEREAAGEEIPGLEIAWHCVRGGREADARPYLLRGAKEAMDFGGPNEAEMALRSGMALFDHSGRAAPQLLLATALQEQGSWTESLETLTEINPVLTPTSAQHVEILSINAIQRLASPRAEASREALERVQEILRESNDLTVSILAAGVGTAICDRLREEPQSASLRSQVSTLFAHELTLKDKAAAHFFLAVLLSHEGMLPAALDNLEAAQTLAAGEKLTNSLACSIHNGLAASRIALGEYGTAVSICTRAYQLATQLGNDNLAGRAAVNTALCYGRLGYHHDQREWATIPVRTDDDSVEVDILCSAYGNVATASAYLGDLQRVEEAVSKLLRVHRNYDIPWVQQRLLLTSADALWIVGQRARAVELARSGTTAELCEPKSASIAGMFARWKAVVAKMDGGLEDAFQSLAILRDNLARYDAIDRAEILCAEALLSGVDLRSDHLVREALSRLPDAVEGQLRTLGVLGA